MSLRDVSLASRRRWHTIAFSLVAFWIVAGVGITVANIWARPSYGGTSFILSPSAR
ncbi:hypothetical protein [Corynebacterium aurimucosum]|uniref:hypothetical protein n=1 Tax=Corynebacterium aurimucosum TaxID=169292 RepID=UPI0021CB325D|nr:hypothetical protein [Corynebacterium aurimucosum]